MNWQKKLSGPRILPKNNGEKSIKNILTPLVLPLIRVEKVECRSVIVIKGVEEFKKHVMR